MDQTGLDLCSSVHRPPALAMITLMSCKTLNAFYQAWIKVNYICHVSAVRHQTHNILAALLSPCLRRLCAVTVAGKEALYQ